MVTPARRVLRHAAVCRADARALLASSHTGRRRRHAARPAARPRPAGDATRPSRRWPSTQAMPVHPAGRAAATRTSHRRASRLAPDLGVVAAYGKLMPEDLLAAPAPRHDQRARVAAAQVSRRRPVHRAVIDGERETGVTIMRVVKALDAGGDAREGHAADRSRRDERRRRARLADSAPRCCVDVVDAAGRRARP